MVSKINWNPDNTFIFEQTIPPKRITGTKFASILGKNPYIDEFETWCDIVHAYDFPFEGNMFTEAGVAIEPIQARYIKDNFYPNLKTPTDKFGEDYFNKTYGNFFRGDGDIFGGMWDYIEETDVIESVFEMKTTGVKKKVNWEIDIPEYYALQGALYAYKLGIEQVHMVVSFLEYKDYLQPYLYIPNENNTLILDFKLHERYPNFETEYIEVAKKWWQEHVLTGLSPQYNEQKHKNIIDSLKGEEMIDFEKVDMLVTKAETDAEKVQSIVDKVVESYTGSLYQLMGDINIHIVQQENPSSEVLEKYLLELSNCLFFVCERTEQVGIYDSITKISYQEAYNKAYLDNQNINLGVAGAKKPTVAESTAVAENSTIEENVVNDIYNKTYKIIRARIDSANTMVSSISKVLSKRMSESQLNYTSGRQMLNEEAVY